MKEYLQANGSLRTDAPYEFKISHIKSRIIAVHGATKFNLDTLEYTTAEQKVKIWCNKHQGYFYALVSALYKGSDCGVCYSSGRVHDQSTFLTKALQVHGPYLYDYSATIYSGSKVKTQIKCNACGNVFMQCPAHHLRGANCPACSNKSYRLLYFLQSDLNTALYKIGVTSNLSKRLKDLRLELKQSWSVLGLYHFNGGNTLPYEQQLHKELSAYSYRGDLVPPNGGHTEVFKLTSGVASSVQELIISKGGVALDG